MTNEGTAVVLSVLFCSLERGRKTRDQFIWDCQDLLTPGRFKHVAFAVHGVVLNPMHCGDRWYDEPWYWKQYPGLEAVVLVPVREPPPPERWARPRRRIWPSLLRWVTRGRTRSEDCVQATRDYLAACGLPVPTNLISPDELHQWLLGQGYLNVPRATDPRRDV